MLAETATLEDVAALLWQAPVDLSPQQPAGGQGIAAAFQALAAHAGQSPISGRHPATLAREAGRVFGTLAHALAGTSEPGEPLHRLLAQRWERPDAADPIRRALVLLADHELNASTFAARVTVSTGASLWAGTLAGLAALSGPQHGQASRGIAALVGDVSGGSEYAEDALREWLGEGRHVPGMGHPLYPYGDPRCMVLLESFDLPPEYRTYRQAAEAITGDLPNIDFALAALAARFALPGDAGFTLFALARSAGWLAHMMEQVASGEMIRPRARYVG
jgi:citrate synthase